VLIALLLVGVPFLLMFHRLQWQREMERLTEATEGLSRVLVDGLRSAMLAGQPHVLDQTIRNLAQQDPPTKGGSSTGIARPSASSATRRAGPPPAAKPWSLGTMAGGSSAP
jgi:hypothetical protein